MGLLGPNDKSLFRLEPVLLFSVREGVLRDEGRREGGRGPAHPAGAREQEAPEREAPAGDGKRVPGPGTCQLQDRDAEGHRSGKCLVNGAPSALDVATGPGF